MTELYEKAVEGQWYDPRTRKTVQVFAITYEVTQKPNREKTLIMEILYDFPDAGNFEYADDVKLEYEGGMPVYPQIQVGSTNKREILHP
ncbi:protein of unknown function [Nitrosotalea devaniterrae]|uniref:Uncharacterized protein n=1 Tax=Nitrosotalea devaniterrae TaxID=1078905 RepID=A0A128A4D6_9ARCH|nr:protein of unknown function [Candidatus Nitrosotalea devanaterra]